VNITISADQVSSGRLTLVPNETCTVSFEQNIGAVQVLSNGAGAAFYTVDGSEPTIDGLNTFELPDGVHSVDERDTTNLPGAPTDVIKILSAASPTIRVQLA
jgi:hypothetical protein